MDLPDCMEVCSFSTTSPSWMMSCLTLMPVISSNARVSVFDSYSCVVMVSDTTEISFTPLACSFLAASMNHFISSNCWALVRVDGWNSLSTHFLAAASSAQAWPDRASAAAIASAVCLSFMSSPWWLTWWLIWKLPAAHDERQNTHGHHETDPDAGFLLQPEPCGEFACQPDEGQVDIARGEQADEKPVATGGGDRQEPFAHRGGGLELPHGHACERQPDAGEKNRHRRGPDHPVEH